MTGLRNNKSVELLARIERLRRKSMPGQDYRYQPQLSTILSAAPATDVVEGPQAQPAEEVIETPTIETPAKVVEAPIEVVEELVEPEQAPAAVKAVDPVPAEVEEPEPAELDAPEIALEPSTTPSTPTRTRSPSPELAPASPLQAKSPFVAQADGQEATLVASPARMTPLAVRTEQLLLEDDGLPSDHLDSIDLGTHGVADLSVEPESPIRTVEAVQESPAVEVEDVQVEPEALLVQEELVEEPVAAEAQPVELAPTPSTEQPEPVQEPVQEAKAPLVEPAQPAEVHEPTPAVEKIEEDEAAPVARGRGRPAKAKAAPKKSAIPTRGRKAAVKVADVEDEPEVADAEPEPIVEEVKRTRAKAVPKAAIPTRRGRVAKGVEAVGASLTAHLLFKLGTDH